MLHHLLILLFILRQLLAECHIDLLEFLLQLCDALLENLLNLGHDLGAHGISHLFLDDALDGLRRHIGISLRLSLLNQLLEQLTDLILDLRKQVVYLLIQSLHLLCDDWDHHLFYLLSDKRRYTFFNCLPNNGFNFDFLLLLPVNLLLQLIHLLSQVLILACELLKVFNNLVLHLGWNGCHLFLAQLFWGSLLLLGQLLPLFLA